MTRKVSTAAAAEAHTESARAESVSPAVRRKRQGRPAAATSPTTEPADRGRGPSRREQLIRMLSARNGTELAVISARFGWLPHTTRAALSGLRKSGQAVVTEKRADGKPTRYRIAAQTGGASPGDGLPSATGVGAPESPPSTSDATAPTPAPVDPMTKGPDNGSVPGGGAA